MSHTRSPQLPGPAPAPDDDTAPENTAGAEEPKRDSEEGSAAAAETGPAPEGESGATAAPGAGAAPEPEPEPEPEPGLKERAEPADQARPASAPKPQPQPQPQPQPGNDSGSAPATGADATPESAAAATPEPAVAADATPEPAAEAHATPEPAADTPPEPATEDQADPETATEVQADPETTVEHGRAAGPSVAPETADVTPDSDADADVEAHAEAESRTAPGVEARAEPDSASAQAPAGRDRRARHPRRARILAWTGTGLAVAFVMFALLMPNDMTKFEVGRLLRIPAEGILGAALLLVLPPRARRVAVVVIGAVLGLLMIVKVLDMGSYWTLDRPFDLVLDWPLLDNARSFMKDSLGNTAAQAATIGVIALVLALPFLTTFAVRRISRLMERDRHTASRTLLVLGTVWITCSTLTLEVAGVPLASHSAATLVENRIESVREGLKDGEAFQKQAAVDAFADVPPDQLLTGLRGKDVLITFIESYGRSAIDNPQMGEPLSETLAQKTQELKDAGYASRSGWLRSPITGAGSWLGHSTFLSGLWIKNQSRYNHLVASDRLTLTEAFRRTGAWRTVGIVPGTQKAWPEGKYFGLDHIYDSDQLGYQGPKFSWSTMPDQYTLKAFRELEYGKEGRKPMMAEIILTSSHNPWAPIPRTIPEEEIGDGSVYHDLQKAEGKDPKEVWKDPLAVRDEYRKTIQYSVSSIVDFVAKYGSKDTVLIFLGDHQPNKTVTGDNPSHDVPVSVVAQDPKVLEKIADWGWADGLKPASDTPVWRMDEFRDQFMTAFGPQQPGGTS